MYKFSNSSLSRMAGIDDRLKRVANRAIELSRIDFGVPMYGGLRSEQDQNYLFSTGKSKADGYHSLSYHQTGLAIDVYAYVDGSASWDNLHLAMVAAAMLQAANELGIPLEWGGLWTSFVDMPHFQIKG